MVREGVNYAEKARTVIDLEVRELGRLAERLGGIGGEAFGEAVEVLRGVLEDGRKIVVAGVGKSGDIGHKIAATLNSTGATAVVLNSQNALHGDLGLVARGDAVIVMSHSGETAELLDLLPHLKRRAGVMVGVTGCPESSLGKACDVVLDCNVEREACPLNLAPTSSSTVMLVLGDALAMVLLESRGFGQEDFAELHPGGSLGRALLTRVADIMRAGANLALVGRGVSVREALAAMTGARSGAAVVVDGGGRLEGIFTQGDFARAYQADAGVGERPVSELMTVGPVTVEAGRLAVEVLKLLETHRIDDLVVLDGDGCVVGMVDTQDLSRLRIL